VLKEKPRIDSHFIFWTLFQKNNSLAVAVDGRMVVKRTSTLKQLMKQKHKRGSKSPTPRIRTVYKEVPKITLLWTFRVYFFSPTLICTRCSLSFIYSMSCSFLPPDLAGEKLVMSEIIIRGRYRSSLLLCRSLSFVIRFHIDLYYSTRAVRDPSI
jgi:hypothetical protein